MQNNRCTNILWGFGKRDKQTKTFVRANGHFHFTLEDKIMSIRKILLVVDKYRRYVI